MVSRRTFRTLAVTLALAVPLTWAALVSFDATSPARTARAGQPKEEMMLVHNVFFTVRDRSPEYAAQLVVACDKWLTDHPGTLFYAAGTLADLDREVNDRDFDVGLHLVFENREAHDAYQVSERHQRFIDENRHLWTKVRVFDSVAERKAKSK
jgi:quinol monooxygenase YgiN